MSLDKAEDKGELCCFLERSCQDWWKKGENGRDWRVWERFPQAEIKENNFSLEENIFFHGSNDRRTLWKMLSKVQFKAVSFLVLLHFSGIIPPKIAMQKCTLKIKWEVKKAKRGENLVRARTWDQKRDQIPLFTT